MLRHSRIILLSILVVFAFLPMSCREKAMPKPRGYFRIDFPEKNMMFGIRIILLALNICMVQKC